LNYIDKVDTEVEETVETFLGSKVHETLEKLYRDLRHQKENTLEELLNFLHAEWKKNWKDAIVIVKEDYGQENYLKMAQKNITDYYKRYYPFNQGKTIALEELIRISLDESGNYKLQGYIDRLMETKDGYYEIHDYKTNSRLPLPDYIRQDRQLALYAIGVKEKYPDVKDIRLVWHFLAFDKEIDSTRTDKELTRLKQDTIQLIDTIEKEDKFPANPSFLCKWCEFKPVCRQWSHLSKLEDKPVNEYYNDPGVKLVNNYAELKNKQKQIIAELDVEIEKLEEAIKHFAEKENIDVVFGSGNKVRITINKRYSFPSKNSMDRKELEQLLKKFKKWDEVVQIDTSALSKILQEKTWEKELINVVEKYTEIECSKRLYLSKINTE
jgi:putative RecB family exonuclease